MSTALAIQGNGTLSASPNNRVQLGGAMAMAQTIEDLNTIREFIKGAMVEKTDYGVIPGTGSKPTLLLPGAQKILMYFNCYPDYEVQPHELPGGHVEYIVKTLLRSRASQNLIGSGIGSCSTMEKKYRWRTASRVCPACGVAAIIRGKEEYGGGWVCFKKKDGCGYNFDINDPAITSQPFGQVENPDIYDQRNTALKMAKKRSLVDSAHGLGCMSELFTQDMEEHVAEPDDQPSRDREPARERSREARPTNGGSTQGGAPRSGKGLFAWIKEQEQVHEISLLKHINSWAKLKDMPGRMVDWDVDAVNLAYAEATRKIQSIQAGHAAPPPAEDNAAPEQAESSTKVMGRFSVCLNQYCQRMNAAWADRHMSEDGVIPSWVGELINSFQLVSYTLEEAGVTFPNGGNHNERMKAASELWLAGEAAVLAKWNAYVKGLADDLKRKHAGPTQEDENQEASAIAGREPGSDDDLGE